jgi:hypothetical protein
MSEGWVLPDQRWRAAGATLGVLAVLALLAVLDIQPPDPRPASAPTTEFSAERAYAHVTKVGAKVHVAGSPAADEVRQYIVDTLNGYGLRTEAQDGTGVNGGKFGEGSMARVRNVIGVLAGTESTGRVILVAHYDSVQISNGANDDGAGVATLLETARVMSEAAQPRNDIVFVFTDAEEACLCGAEAFVTQHEIGRAGGVVLNFEARGSRGPVIMFETSLGNAGLVGLYGRVAPYPVGTSVAVEVYRTLPNDTDFTPFLSDERFSGLNAAYIDGSSRYHTPQDTPTNMDRSSLQQHGDNALALARELGAVDLGPLRKLDGGDATYFPFAGTLIRYPGWLVWPLALLAAAAVAALAWFARRRELLSYKRLAGAFGLALVPLVLAVVAAQAFWWLLCLVRPGYAEMIDPHRPLWFRWAVLALTATVLFTWYGLLRRRVGAVPLALGALTWLALLGLVLAAAAPGGSYLAALPALVCAFGGLAALVIPSTWGRLAVLTAAVAVPVLILTPTVALFLPALGLAMGAAAALLTVLLGLAALPVLELLWPSSSVAGDRRRGSAPAAIGLAVTLLFSLLGLAVDGFDAGRPLPTHLMYALDADSGKAMYVSRELRPSTWTKLHVSRQVPGSTVAGQFPVLASGPTYTVGDAPAASLPAPELTVLSDETAGSQRTLRFRVQPKRGVRLVAVHLADGGRLFRATVGGRAVPSDWLQANPFGIVYHAPAADGVEMTFVAPAGPVKLRVSDGSDGLAGLPEYIPRPADVSAVGSHSSDLVLVARTLTV